MPASWREYPVASVVRVIDGDTIVADIDLGFGVFLRDQHVRLAGIDTPESRTRDPVEGFFGEAAKAHLTSMLSDSGSNDGIFIRCDTKHPRDKYGRVLGDIIILQDGQCEKSVAQMLVYAGHAVRYDGKSKAAIEEEHVRNRQQLLAYGVVDRAAYGRLVATA